MRNKIKVSFLLCKCKVQCPLCLSVPHPEEIVENSAVSPGCARAGGSLPTAAGAEPCHSTRRLWSLCWVNLTAQEAAVPCSRKICNSYLSSTSGNQFDQRSMPIRKTLSPNSRFLFPTSQRHSEQ